jgi:SNF2 family DNA or RNA helicase
MEQANEVRKVPFYKKPDDLTVDEWQTLLRKQYAVQQKFNVTNVGEHAVYSDFEVFNPTSKNTYKVSLRDNITSSNFCSCPDFKVNGLGTCKHVEYVLHSLLRYKKYQKIYNKPLNTDYSSLSVDYGNERIIRLKKHDNSIEFTNEQVYFDENGYLIEGKLETLDCFISDVVEMDKSFKIYPDVFDVMSQHKKDSTRIKLAAELFPKGIDSDIFNGLINANLYPYQKEGVIKLFQTGRTLLADEMGLGKTIQAIASVELFEKHLDVKQVLIICPTSLKYQWKNEIEKFTNRSVTIVEGLIHKRKELYKQDTFYKIVSYGACLHDTQFINELGADLIILDEAQRIKSWKTKTAQAVKRINSEYAIVLTGTPLENRIDELHSVIEFIDQYKLGPLFKFLDNHQLLDENGKVIGYTGLRDINKTLEHLLIRRTKKEIADQLPNRIDKNFFVEMTSEQKTDHDSYYDIVTRMVNKWIKFGFLSEEDRKKLLMALSCMRMVCDNTYILNQDTNHGNKVEEIIELIKELVEGGDNKIVVFSQWKKMFELIINELEKTDIQFVYLNGDIPAASRNQMIENFQNDSNIKVFLSTDAGGVGVNLQSANILINVDIPWNPAVLEQRIARIYRLGQKKQVSVFNFVSEASIEHQILYLLDFKKSVFAGVIEEDGEDQVMRESFMESVKTLTDIKIGADERYIPKKKQLESTEGEETPSLIEDEEDKTTVESLTIENIQENEMKNQTEEAVAQEKQPMLSLKNKIIRFFSKLFRK